VADTLFRCLLPIGIALSAASIWSVGFAYPALAVLAVMLACTVVSAISSLRRR